MAEALKKALPDGGNIFAIYGSPTDYNTTMVKKGFLEALSGSNLNIVYSNYCENWLAELAFDAVEEGLATTPRNLVGVMCGNDDLASPGVPCAGGEPAGRQGGSCWAGCRSVRLPADR